MNGLEYVLKLYDVTQQELADKLGIKQQNIDLWIRDKSRKIPKKWLPKLAEIFNIPEKYFQKDLTLQDKEKIQMMKLFKTNNEEELGYSEEDDEKKYEEDESQDTIEFMKSWKNQELVKFNAERENLLKMVHEIIDLGVGNGNYSQEMCLFAIAIKYPYINLINKFLNILNDINKSRYTEEIELLGNILTSYELFQGKDLPYDYTDQSDIDLYNKAKKNGYKGEIPKFNKKRVEFVYKMMNIIQDEEKRITGKKE